MKPEVISLIHKDRHWIHSTVTAYSKMCFIFC